MHHVDPRTTLLLCGLLASAPLAAQWEGFENVLTIDSGLNAPFQMDFRFTSHFHLGGAVAGDVNGDGHHDVFIMRGGNSPRLFVNDGDGTFSDATSAAGLAGIDGLPNGAVLADITGNGAPDLLMGGMSGDRQDPDTHTPMRVFFNDGSGVFTDATAESNLSSSMDAHSMALADIDGDGDLDLFVAYWQPGPSPITGHLWRNLGDGTFADISAESGIGQWYEGEDILWNFTPTFADINDDGHPDLLVAADFGHSRVFVNNGDGTFGNATEAEVITDENGMGAATGDFDNDGDMDWFVTAIWDEHSSPHFGTSGNRFYRNDGGGRFTDTTDAAGVRVGHWGWGSCAADFNNDGWLDLFMVNGYQTHTPDYLGNPAKLFINNGDGSFSEQAQAAGIDSTGQGRAVVCFDSDGDGHIDVLVQNSHAMGETVVQPQLFRNRGSDHHWLRVRLQGPAPNHDAIGARVTLEAGEVSQVREIRAGARFLSSEVPEAHFGLGDHDNVASLTVEWPDGRTTRREDIAADRTIDIAYDELFHSRFE